MKYLLNILILLSLIALIVLKINENKQIVEKRVFHFDKSTPIHVITQKVALESGAITKKYTGTFIPNKDAKINAEMQGKIVSIAVDEGDFVKKGSPLIMLDDELLQLQLKKLDVKIQGLKTDIQRFRILNDAQAIQGIQLEKAELSLRTAEAEKATILEKMSKTTIYAPFSGVITKRLVDVGSFAAPGIPLMFLTDIKSLKFRVFVTESELSRFQLNHTYTITVDAYPEMQLKGRTSMIATKGNPGNSFEVQFDLKNTRDLKIKSGMYGKLIFDKKLTDQKNILIPAKSIVGSSIAPKVYVVQDGKAVLKNVTVSSRVDDKIIIKSGLSAYDQIITGGFINIYDGANVVYDQDIEKN